MSWDEEELEFYWIVTYDADGVRAATSGFGITIERTDGRHFRNIYGYDNGALSLIDYEPIEFEPIELCRRCIRVPVEIVCLPPQFPPIDDGCLGICHLPPYPSACGSLMSYYGGEVCTARWEYVCLRSFHC